MFCAAITARVSYFSIRICVVRTHRVFSKMAAVSKKPFQRLPTKVKPVNYELVLKPDLQAFKFEGNVKITVEVKEAVKEVKLNAADLEFKEVSFQEEGKDIMEGRTEVDKEEETVTLKFDSDLKVGKGCLEIAYTGTLNDKMKGFYRTMYKTPWGEERYAAATQFEATDARRALPCWDEPSHKATFDVTMEVPHDRVALSNMNAIRVERIRTNKKKVTFARTPRMSTYLLAFVVGEFDYVEGNDEDGVLIRVYTPLLKAKQGQYALEIAKKTLPFYKKYFGVAYPLPKMDLITIPDFAAGAMENWGLVTYRERLLLVDPENSSLQNKQLVALVVGHELAHQWFGNLVTMEWWTHLWLNEGFATWIEYLCVDHCEKDFDIWTQFNNQTYVPALKSDALANSHPIEVKVGHPSEVEEIFDAISYSKGASIIRMLHDWIGDEAFKKGMNAYLTKHKYGNTETSDLWSALGAASQMDVHKVMGTWTNKMGYPVLDVRKEESGGEVKLTIKQKKFCVDGNDEKFEDYIWQIPVSVEAKNWKKTFLITEKEQVITLKGAPSGSWIKLNPGRKGFYRVHYSTDMMEALKKEVSSFPPTDKLGLLDEAVSLALACVAETKDFLILCQGYKEETNYTVWENMIGSLTTLDRLLSDSNLHDAYKRCVLRLLNKVVETVGWEKKEGETPLDSMLRPLVLGCHGKFGGQNTLDEAVTRLANHLNKKANIPVDLRGVVYSLAMRKNSAETFDKLYELAKNEDLQEEKVRLYRAMCSSDHEESIQKCLELGLKDEIRPADAWIFFVASSMSSAKGREETWKFIQDNFAKIEARFDGLFLLPRIIEMTTNLFTCEEKAKQIETFFEKHQVPSATRVIQQSLESVRNNARWLRNEKEALMAFLEA